MIKNNNFLITLRFLFVIFSLHFLRDAFYKWDGYSYYMSFISFLPSLSLAYILWSLIGVIFAVIIWIVLSALHKIIPGSMIRFEHILLLCIVVLLPLYVKRIYFSDFSFSMFFGYNRGVILFVGSIAAILIFWFCSRYAEKIISSVNQRISPLVWIFLMIFILSLPFSYLALHKPETIDKSSKAPDTAMPYQNRPNIILVIMDTLTAENMQLYGYHRPTTPFISEWSKNTLVFNNAYASSNWTTPAVMSIMTGQELITHGVWHLIYYHPLEKHENHLPALMKQAGYDVLSFVQNPSAHPDTLGIKDAFTIRHKSHDYWLKSDWWLDKLKSFFLSDPIVKEWIFEMNPIAKRINYFRPANHTTLVPPNLIYDAFIKFISERSAGSDQPYFAWLLVFPPHDYYLPPEPFMGMFGDADRYISDTEQELAELGSPYDPERQPDIDILRKRYDEFILYSDKEFEKFISRLSDTADLSNTIIILTSDHGESFSNGWLAHRGPHLFESLVHVPLLIKMPGDNAGRSTDVLVDHTDLAPTILELAGLQVPEWIEGRSLVPVINGHEIQSEPVFSMQFSNTRITGSKLIDRGTIAVWDNDYKLVYYLEDKKKLLFDLGKDPDETINISDEKSEIANKMLDIILRKLDKPN